MKMYIAAMVCTQAFAFEEMELIESAEPTVMATVD